MENKKKLAVFISGRGSNLEAILKTSETEGDFPAEVTYVFSNVETAGGLGLARTRNIATGCQSHKNFDTREDFERAILQDLPHDIDIICLAGFMRILSPYFIEQWAPKPVLNIHPSLLPAYKGLDPQKQALADNASESGCSVHYVTTELDGGPVILQRKVPILDNDTEDTLSARILAEEHIAYPQAIRIVADTI